MKIPMEYHELYTCQLPTALYNEVMKEVEKEVSTLLLTDQGKEDAIEQAEYEKIKNLTDLIKIEFVNEERKEMKLESYGYTEKVFKARKMTLAEMRIGILQMLFKKSYNFAHIRMVEITSGEVDTFKTTNDFLMADFNESWEINLLSVKEILIYNEEDQKVIVTIVILFEDAEA